MTKEPELPFPGSTIHGGVDKRLRDQGGSILDIRRRMSAMDGLPTDSDRARLAIQLAADVGALPAGPTASG